MGEESTSFYEFGPYRLDAGDLCLLRNGQLVPLPPKALEILVLLVTHHGHLLTKEELMRRVWPDAFVEESNLAVSMSKIRKVLRENKRNPKYICTIPGRGYRFIADVRRISEATLDSILVLPFEAVGEAERLTDGITESVIYSLSALRNLRIIPASSVLQYKGTNLEPRRIGIESGVGAVLTGRISTRHDSFLVSIELLDVHRNELIWGEHYLHQRSNSLETLDDIALQIVESIKIRVSPIRERAKLTNEETDRLYLRGRFYWNKRSNQALRKATHCFKEAIRVDKANARAYAGLADSYNVLGFYTLLAPKIAFSRAKAAASRAIAIDPYSAEAHAALGYTRLYYDWDVPGSRASIQYSLKLKPESATAHQYYANLLTVMGEFDAGIAQFKCALAIDPLSLIINAALGYCYYYARRFDDAIEQFKNVIELDQDFEPAHIWLGSAYQQKGQWQEALSEYGQAVDLSGTMTEVAAAYAHLGDTLRAKRILSTLKVSSKEIYVSPYCIACVYVALGDFQNAFDSLERAFEDRSHLLMGLKIDPRLDRLRPYRTFEQLLKRMP
jgi:DNA-binding winged helix-turn-helix (wHTH) protein/tetratricopeptide (TPR) repeat protein